MKFSYSWLRQYLDTDASASVLVDRLTRIGLEVEKVVSYDSLNDFTVAHVLSTEPHPNADSLKLCTIHTAIGESVVVCGASNVRPDIAVLYASVGMVIPASGMVLKEAMIRGVPSAGMLLSFDEMGLPSSDSDGIVVLPLSIPVGTSAPVALGLSDIFFDVSVTPNRSDCLGVYGIARDLAASGLGVLKPLDVPSLPMPFKSHDSFGTAAPYILTACLGHVENKPSPPWLVACLQAAGLTPKHFLADITNYMTFAFARPVHCYGLSSPSSRFQINLLDSPLSFMALTGKSYDLSAGMPIVFLDDVPSCIAGIMGSLDSSATIDTTNVLVEVALFDSQIIAQTAQQLDIFSDARHRFERGVDPSFMPDALALVVHYILAHCGGQVTSLDAYGTMPAALPSFSLSLPSITRLLGITPSLESVSSILQSLGCSIDIQDSSTILVSPPSFRPDLRQEADCVEEVLRMLGIDDIPFTPLPSIEHGFAVNSPPYGMIHQLKSRLAALGMMEVLSMSFISHKQAESFPIASPDLFLENPISQDLVAMRPSLLPSLLSFIRDNANNGTSSLRLFEVSAQFSSTAQETVASGMLSGNFSRLNPHGTPTRLVDAFDAKAIIFSLLERLGFSGASLRLSHDVPSWYHPTQSGALLLGSSVIAFFGSLHPTVLQHADVTSKVVAFEFFPLRLPVRKRSSFAIAPMPTHILQPISRDFAFLVDFDLPADSLVRAVLAADKTLIIDVRIFDIYVGEGIPPLKKSIALSVVFQPRETMNDAAITDFSQKIISHAMKVTGAVLR